MGSVIDFRGRSVRPAEDDIDTRLKLATLRVKELEIDRLSWELRHLKAALIWQTVKRMALLGVVVWLITALSR